MDAGRRRHKVRLVQEEMCKGYQVLKMMEVQGVCKGKWDSSNVTCHSGVD